MQEITLRVYLYYMPTRYVNISHIGTFLTRQCLWLQALLLFHFVLLLKTCNDLVTLTFLVPFVVVFFFAVVQKVDSVSEGIENYGGKIIAVETDLKKLGMYLS